MQAENQVVAAEEQEEEQKEEPVVQIPEAAPNRIILLQAISEIEDIKDEEIQANQAILKGEDHKVNADSTLQSKEVLWPAIH